MMFYEPTVNGPLQVRSRLVFREEDGFYYVNSFNDPVEVYEDISQAFEVSLDMIDDKYKRLVTEQLKLMETREDVRKRYKAFRSLDNEVRERYSAGRD